MDCLQRTVSEQQQEVMATAIPVTPQRAKGRLLSLHA
jgi:hypothetical protein